MFISAVNIPSEQKTGLKRELSQQQEGLFKEKEKAKFLLFRGEKKGSKTRDEILKCCLHTNIFSLFFCGFYPKDISTASDHLWQKMSELSFLHI